MGRERGGSRVLVSGAGGFLGRHLCPLLAANRQIIGADLSGVEPSFDGEWHAVEPGTGLAELVQRLKPDFMVHAAFRNRKPSDWTRLEYLSQVLQENSTLFEACAAARVNVLLLGSSAVYGSGLAAGTRLDETAPRHPTTLYGLAKAIQELLGESMVTEGLHLCVARLFNLIGPGQAAGMLIPDWVRQLAAIADGAEPRLVVRHRATSRDFVDVRDAAAALALLIDDYRPGETVNVATGTAVHLREISDFLATLCPRDFEIIETDPQPPGSDVISQRGDPTRIKARWGWEPTVPWRQSVADVWDACRERTH